MYKIHRKKYEYLKTGHGRVITQRISQALKWNLDDRMPFLQSLTRYPISSMNRMNFLETNNRYKRKHSNILHRIDWTLIILLLSLATISVISISSSMTGGQHNIDFSVRQIIFYVSGFSVMIIMIFIPVNYFKRYIWVIFGFSMFSLLVLYVSPVSPFTPIINGAKRWFQLGCISIQPSEFAKLAYIMTLGYIISQHNRYKLNNSLGNDVKLLYKMSILSVLPMFFVLAQNDLGTMIVFIVIFLGMTIVSGVSWWLILPTLGVAVTTGSSLLIGIIYRPDLLQTYLGVRSYQFERIYSWLSPETNASDSGFQISNSMRAIGSGGMDGKGFGGGAVYIPESHTDFIFTIIGEESGFIGSTIVIVIFFMLMVHLIRIALVVSDDFSSYVIIGYLSMLGFQVFQNIGMTIQLLPITGLPLPFLSYGGSGLWGNMMAMGVVMSIHFHQYSRKS